MKLRSGTAGEFDFVVIAVSRENLLEVRFSRKDLVDVRDGNKSRNTHSGHAG
jgi:hypothetical protein